MTVSLPVWLGWLVSLSSAPQQQCWGIFLFFYESVRLIFLNTATGWIQFCADCSDLWLLWWKDDDGEKSDDSNRHSKTKILQYTWKGLDMTKLTYKGWIKMKPNYFKDRFNVWRETRMKINPVWCNPPRLFKEYGGSHCVGVVKRSSNRVLTAYKQSKITTKQCLWSCNLCVEEKKW